MIRAIAIKELRETWWMALLALCLALQMLPGKLQRYGNGPEGLPFVDDHFIEVEQFFFLLAIVLGLRQSAWERLRGTYPFLLHRPARRSAVFATKMAVGLGLLLLTAAVPIVGYGVWASLSGTHASPFEWSMSAPAWSCWLSLPLGYLGAFISGIFAARWYGTRLLPGVAGGLLFLAFFEKPWPIAIIGSVVLSGMLASLACYLGETADFA